MVKVIESEEEFKTILKEAGDKLVCVDFTASWCGPCKVIGPKFVEFHKELGNFIGVKVDVDDLESLSGEYEVSAMPTFIFIKNGKKIDTLVGADAKKLKELLVKHA